MRMRPPRVREEPCSQRLHNARQFFRLRDISGITGGRMPRPSVVTGVRFLFGRGRFEAEAVPVGPGHLPRVWPVFWRIAEWRATFSYLANS